MELVVQGPHSAVNGLVQQIGADFQGAITETLREPWPGEEEYSGFEIRF